MPEPKTPLQRERDRWNAWILLVPGQWFGLMAVFWMRFFPPLRPTAFEVPFPSLATLAACAAASCVPFVLPRAYFRPRDFERGRFYARFGLRAFRYLATDGDFINRRLRRTDPGYRVIRDRDALRTHIQGTYSNERWHLAFFIAGMSTIAFAVHWQQWIFAALLAVTNTVFNLYPVMHQRYKRARARSLAGAGETELARDDDRR